MYKCVCVGMYICLFPITIDVPFRSFLIIFNRYRKKAENKKENEYNDQVEYNRIRKESYR